MGASLGLQLMVGHNERPWYEKKKGQEMPYLVRQVSQVQDVIAPASLDWFFGGLNFHSLHHVLPRFPRCFMREVYPQLQAICKKHNITV